MNLIDRFLSLIAPHSCVGCDHEGSLYCGECADIMERLPSICYACARATHDNTPCASCLSHSGPQHVWITTTYKGGPKLLIKAYKFEEKRAAAARIAELIDESLPYFPDPPLVAFVPTVTSHRRARGFDHAEYIARELAKGRDWHYARLLHRTSQVRQLGATREQRQSQLKGLFRPINKQLIKNRHILLVDDVITTGATVGECARVLYKNGAAKVDVAAFARTPEK